MKPTKKNKQGVPDLNSWGNKDQLKESDIQWRLCDHAFSKTGDKLACHKCGMTDDFEDPNENDFIEPDFH